MGEFVLTNWKHQNIYQTLSLFPMGKAEEDPENIPNCDSNISNWRNFENDRLNPIGGNISEFEV
jgi:hypothetical protein